MKGCSVVCAGLALSLGLSTAAIGGPDLKPKFGATSGTIRVGNVGDADAAGSWVTVQCAGLGGSSCPDPNPADVAPYLSAAFPYRIAVKVPALSPGQQYNHVIAFFNDLEFAPGSYSFIVCADAGDDVADDSELNNCLKVQKTVRRRVGGPDGLIGNTSSD